MWALGFREKNTSYSETPYTKEKPMKVFKGALKFYFLTLAFIMIVILGLYAFLSILLAPLG